MLFANRRARLGLVSHVSPLRLLPFANITSEAYSHPDTTTVGSLQLRSGAGVYVG